MFLLKINYPKDIYIQSKGHCVEALYVVLADKGFFRRMIYWRFVSINLPTLVTQPEKLREWSRTRVVSDMVCLFAVEAEAAKKINQTWKFTPFRAMAKWQKAPTGRHLCLQRIGGRPDKLCAILDYNNSKLPHPMPKLWALEPLDKKLEAFGWAVRHVDGNDVKPWRMSLIHFRVRKTPFIIAHTTKGKGVSYMENVLNGIMAYQLPSNTS